jgi:hypothetical protein
MGKVQKAWHSLKQTFFFFLLPVVFLGVTVCPCLEQAPLLQTIIRQSHVPVNRPGIHPSLYELVSFGRACAPVSCAHPSFWAHKHARNKMLPFRPKLGPLGAYFFPLV